MTTSVLPVWLKPANRVVMALQRLGLAIGTMRVLSVPGRKSSKMRSTPVSPLTVNGQRYIIGGFAQGDWVKNARAVNRATGRGTRPYSARVSTPGTTRRTVFPAGLWVAKGSRIAPGSV